MAYVEIPSYSSQTNLIDQIETAIAANGWTVDASVAGPPRKINFHRAIGGIDFHFSIQSDTGNNRLQIQAYTGAAEAGPSGLFNARAPNGEQAGPLGLFILDDAIYLVSSQAIAFFIGRLNLTFPEDPADVTGAFVFAHFGNGFSINDSTLTGSTGVVRVRSSSGNIWRTDLFKSAAPITSNTEAKEGRVIVEYVASNGLRVMAPNAIWASDLPVPGSGPTFFYVGTMPDLKIMSSSGVPHNSTEVVGADTWRRYNYLSGLAVAVKA